MKVSAGYLLRARSTTNRTSWAIVFASAESAPRSDPKRVLAVGQQSLIRGSSRMTLLPAALCDDDD